MKDNQNRDLEAMRRHREYLSQEREAGYKRFLQETANNVHANWVVVQGVDVLRVADSKYVAEPVTGRKSSGKFDIVDLDTMEFVCQVNRKEVYRWLFRMYDGNVVC